MPDPFAPAADAEYWREDAERLRGIAKQKAHEARIMDMDAEAYAELAKCSEGLRQIALKMDASE